MHIPGGKASYDGEYRVGDTVALYCGVEVTLRDLELSAERAQEATKAYAQKRGKRVRMGIQLSYATRERMFGKEGSSGGYQACSVVTKSGFTPVVISDDCPDNQLRVVVLGVEGEG